MNKKSISDIYELPRTELKQIKLNFSEKKIRRFSMKIIYLFFKSLFHISLIFDLSFANSVQLFNNSFSRQVNLIPENGLISLFSIITRSAKLPLHVHLKKYLSYQWPTPISTITIHIFKTCRLQNKRQKRKQ